MFLHIQGFMFARKSPDTKVITTRFNHSTCYVTCAVESVLLHVLLSRMLCMQDYEMFTGWLRRHAHQPRAEYCTDSLVKMCRVAEFCHQWARLDLWSLFTRCLYFFFLPHWAAELQGNCCLTLFLSRTRWSEKSQACFSLCCGAG